MSALDVRQAKQSLSWWLREWGVTDEPERKARQFIDDMVDRGWVMAADREARPQPPRVTEACRRCGGVKPACACTREQLAAVYDDDTTDTTLFRDAKAAAFAAARQARGQLPIIHQPGCTWETTPYCDCGADPERTTPPEEDATEETL